MIRILIVIALIYFASRYVKSFLNKDIDEEPILKDDTTPKIDDVMVKDPVCDVYFPKKDGIHARIKGQDLYFCSTECKDTYMASKGK